MHSGDKLYSCEVCDVKFSTKRVLKRHLLTHKDEITCLDASEKVPANDEPTFQTEKTFTCEVCDKKFFKQKKIAKHLRKHSAQEISFTLYRLAQLGSLRKISK